MNLLGFVECPLCQFNELSPKDKWLNGIDMFRLLFDGCSLDHKQVAFDHYGFKDGLKVLTALFLVMTVLGAAIASGQDQMDYPSYPTAQYGTYVGPYYSHYGPGGNSGEAFVTGFANGLNQSLQMRQYYGYLSRLQYENYQYQLELMREQDRLQKERRAP